MNSKPESQKQWNGKRNKLLAVPAAVVLLGLTVANGNAQISDADWSALGAGVDNGVCALAVSGTNLYVGGRFTAAGGVSASNIARWDGRAWSGLGTIHNDNGDLYFEVTALAVSGTDLYAGGSFTTAGGVPATNIARWDGRVWSALGSGFNEHVGALAVSGTNLYAGCSLTIAQWDGSHWSTLGSTQHFGNVQALAANATNLYAGAWFVNRGQYFDGPIKWDGSAWSPLGSGVYPCGTLGALAVAGTNLYAGGALLTAGGVPVNGIAKWDGSTWSALGSGLVGIGTEENPEQVWALAVVGNDLYVGGKFTQAGGLPATNIAKWNGSTWSALGSGVNGIVFALAADQAGHLFVGGDFTMAGTNMAAHIAQVNLGHAPTFSVPLGSQTAEAGCIVNLAVRSIGDPPPTYQWFFNGNAIGGSTTNRSLCLAGVQATNAGTYTVVISNRFGAATSEPAMFNIIPLVQRRPVPVLDLLGETGGALNVEYADTLGSPTNWLPLDAVNSTAAPQLVLDTSTPLPPQRFYRVWQTGTLTAPPSLKLPFMVPAITLTGNIGDQLRLDYINQFGPTNAWVNLDTVTLTNTSQLYFDISAPHQPARLYRIVPVP